jgi:hypothetical protein
MTDTVPPGCARYRGAAHHVDRIQTTRQDPSGNVEYSIRFKGRPGKPPWLKAADIAADVVQRFNTLYPRGTHQFTCLPP